jgi:Ca-activated chloride channel family protein
VISEPYGSSGHGVALYELEMGDGNGRTDLKYQTPLLTDSDELCTVKIRYKEPLADVSHEIESVVYNQDAGTKNTELAWFIYCVSEKLRGSDKLDTEDEAFLEKMLAGGKYKELGNREKLTMLVEAMMRNQKT